MKDFVYECFWFVRRARRGECSESCFCEMFPNRFVEVEDVMIMEPVEHLATTLSVSNKAGVSEGSKLMGNG